MMKMRRSGTFSPESNTIRVPEGVSCNPVRLLVRQYEATHLMMLLRATIVDDEPLAIEGLKAQCARVEDVEIVATAADGEAALRLLDAQRPDFLFLDIGMPGLTGIDVAGRL